jgi:aminoglycoside phosphotransferase (APT) family kinase protein
MNLDGPLDIEDPGALRDFLFRTGRIRTGAAIGSRVLAGGVSCRTVLVRLPDGDAWVLKQALEKLRVPGPWFSAPERIHREAAALRWLSRLLPAGATANFVFEDFEAHVLGMTAVAEPHANWKSQLLAHGPAPGQAAEFGRLLATLHRQATRHAPALRAEFGDLTFFEQLRLEAYYGATATSVPEAKQFYAQLIADTLANRLTLVHGDYSPKNVLIAGSRMVLLDHEVVHWGDPGFDLGFALTHLLAKAWHMPSRRTAFARAAAELWTAYSKETLELFPGLEARAVKHTVGCLLARVAGRSLLEYLTPPERDSLRSTVLAQLASPPDSIHRLISTIAAPA